MFLFLKKTIQKINQQSKDFFVEKLQVYDELIVEREKRLKGLNEKLENKQKEIENKKIIPSNSQEVYLYDMKDINYQDEKIFQKMKNIDKRFDINNTNLVKNFIKNNFTEDGIMQYNQFMDIKKKIKEEIIYDVVSKSPKEQEKIIRELLKDNSVILDDFFKKYKRFNILKFVSYFDKIINKVDPYIYIYVGDSLENFDSINPYIVTRVDEDIYKGVSIVYRGKLYDYSLK